MASRSLRFAGNGAAELFTWAAGMQRRMGSAVCPNRGLPITPCLSCWDAGRSCPSARLDGIRTRGLPDSADSDSRVGTLWLTNPHNPTGQLWSRSSLERLLDRYALVICDEASFLVPAASGNRCCPWSPIPIWW